MKNEEFLTPEGMSVARNTFAIHDRQQLAANRGRQLLSINNNV